MELLVLGLVATIGFASYALWSKSRQADETAAPPPPLLDAPDRTPSTLQVGDVVQHLGTDYVVEGALTFSEDGRAARLFRLVDGGAERFLYASPGEPDPLLLDAAPGLAVEGAPETLVHAGQSFRLRSRAIAAVIRAGAVGERRAGDRIGLYEYAAGAARLVVLSWTDQADAFVGERVASHLLELLPGK
ncbi:MAG TPA: DUF4178 domain-containing protein [Polyangia bacterium]|nr:DUF4178 domain-containing protein [Polyangia bacterium]